MASITASGLGSSGLDVNSIVSQLMAIEQQPIKKLDTKEVSYQAKLTAYGTLKSGLAALQDTTHSLTNIASFQTLKATPSDTSLFTAAANNTALAGDYSVDILKLAKQQKLAATGRASTTASIGTGTLTFDFGTITQGASTLTDGKYSSGASFTSNGSGTKTVTIDSTNNSLAGIRDAINAGNFGVSASIVNDGGTSPYRLVLSSTSGAANSLKISVAGDQALTDLLAHDPANSTAGMQQQLATADVADVNALGNTISTTLTFDFGTITDAVSGTPRVLDPITGKYSGATFTSNGAGTKTVTIGSSVTTLAGIRDAINSAGVGVTASISGSHLVLTSNNSGLSDSMKISVAGDQVLSNLLAHDPADDAGQNLAETVTAQTAGQTLAETVTAQNAEIKVNGITASKSSNIVSDVIHGVTLNLLKETTTTASVTVARDASAIKTALEAFVKAYNEVAKPLHDLTAYDPNTQQAAVLQGDSAVRTIQSQMRNVIAATQTGITGSFKSLSQLGVAFQKDGSLAIDSSKLQSAIDSDTGNVATIVASTGGRLKTLMDSLVGSSGPLAAKTNGVNLSLKLLNDQRAKLNSRLAITEQRYRTQYSALDALLSSMKSTSDALTQQLAGLPGSTNSNKTG